MSRRLENTTKGQFILMRKRSKFHVTKICSEISRKLIFVLVLRICHANSWSDAIFSRSNSLSRKLGISKLCSRYRPMCKTKQQMNQVTVVCSYRIMHLLWLTTTYRKAIHCSTWAQFHGVRISTEFHAYARLSCINPMVEKDWKHKCMLTVAVKLDPVVTRRMP